MSSLRSVDLSLIDEVLRGGERGYILDFSNRTFADFFVRELDIDIDAPIYASEGTSKGKRLRCFLSKVDDPTAARALEALWEHRGALRANSEPDPYPRAANQFAAIIAKLKGNSHQGPLNVVAAPKLDEIEFDKIRGRLIAIRDLEPQRRGYEFEGFLRDLFDAFSLEAREPFRNVGEQIDGSFQLSGEVYLLEAKWLNRKVGIAELGTFHAKLEQKATWARGLFVSFGGFSEAGLQAFGKGRRLIAMDGKDIHDSLLRGVGIDRVIAAKSRRAAETGEIYVPIDKLGF